VNSLLDLVITLKMLVGCFYCYSFRQGSTDAVTFWVGTDGYMHFNVGSDQKH